MSTTEATLTAHLVKQDARLDDVLLACISTELHDKFGIEQLSIRQFSSSLATPPTGAVRHRWAVSYDALSRSRGSGRNRKDKRTMLTPQDQTQLQGITLEQLLNALIEHYGWEDLGERVRIRCFTSDPSINSSLKFLRKTPWAREKVESLYLFMRREQERRERSSYPGEKR